MATPAPLLPAVPEAAAPRTALTALGLGVRARLHRSDPLTGLAGRARLHQELTRRLGRARRGGEPVAVVFLDLDDFKLVNAGLGHAAGDQVLRRAATAMRARMRRGDVLGRLGGDEFLALTRGPGDGLAAQLIAAACAPMVVDHVEVRVGASAGVAVASAKDDAAAIIRRADQAMLEAKATGRNRVVRHHPGTSRVRGRAREQVALTSAIPRAIERDELTLHWQPLVDVRSGGLAGLEALVRWNHPERGLLLPRDFIPFAEATGLVGAVDRWVAGAVTEQRVVWRRQGLAPFVGFNFSPVAARRPGALEELLDRLAPDGLGLDHVTVELTESAASREDRHLTTFIRGLQTAGATVALDDFGKAHSSLSRLRDNPVRWVKIDRAFLRGVPEDPAATQILSAMLELVQALGLDYIVEGVEREAQRAFLHRRGARLCQGFLLGRPLPPEELTDALRASPIVRIDAGAGSPGSAGLPSTLEGHA
jgi:diguanylate cyclase (GGDEF)-like protein